MQQEFDSQKTRQRIIWAVGALVLLIFIIGLSRVVYTISSFGKPITPSLVSPIKASKWDGSSVVNVVFTSPNFENNPDISLVSFHPKEKKAVILHIASQTYLELPRGYGSWMIGSVFRLGEEESPKKGGQLLKQSVAKLVGLNIDGIVLVDKKDYNSPEELIASWRKNPLAPFIDLKDIQSDLTASEATKLFTSLTSLRNDKTASLNLEQSNITESKLLADSTRVLGVDTIRLDLFVRDKMADEDVLAEGLSVAVFNGTDHPGLALEAVRVVTNMGGNVITVGNTEVKMGKSSVVTGVGLEEVEKKGATVKRLLQIFAPHCANLTCDLEDPKVSTSRAQINLVLGEDYYRLWRAR